MTEKMLKFVGISKETPTKIKSTERKENFHERQQFNNFTRWRKWLNCFFIQLRSS